MALRSSTRRSLAIAATVGFAVLGLAGPAWASPAAGNAVHPKPRPQPAVAGRHAGRVTTRRHALAPAPVTHAAAPAATGLTTILDGSGRWARLGGSGLALAHAGGTNPRVSVQLLSPAAVAKLGLSGIVLKINQTGATTGMSRVAVSVPSTLLDGIYGADFAGHAQWLQLSGCTATGCHASTALPSRRTPAATAGVPAMTGTDAASSARPAATTAAGALVADVPVGAAPLLVTPMATSNASDGSGDASATSLAPASQWTASPQTGDYTWSDPLRAPPPAAGPTPNLAIAYDSNSINGQTGSTNNQPSQLGEGFDLAGGGFIERSYASCSDAGIANSGDECWKGDNATLSLAGHSSTLVFNGTSWKLADDDNTKVEHLVNNTTYCSNGTYDNDCWRITTTDGTQYYFGRNELPGWTSSTQSTNSAWTVPVCGTASTACTGSATTAGPFNTQAWRWNLDYVVDVHGNSEAFYYTTESNRYAEKSSTTSSVSYVRGGYLSRIDYGMRAGYELTQKAPDQVVFGYGPRCETGVSGEPSGACSTVPPTTANAAYWPDVPWNSFSCNTTACAGQDSPTFWSAEALTSISTQYLSGSSYLPVDAWTLTHAWPDPGDGTTASMTLASITHTGKVGGSLALPPTTFSYTMKPNRVAPPTGVVPLNKPRLTGISTEEGAQITINYLDTDCSGTSPATPETNTKRCFPEYWAPPGQSLMLDWFRLYPVSSVIADPHTGGLVDLPDQTFYDYSIGTPAYRLDTSPLTPNGQRTWSVFAGFSKVRVEHGDPNDPTNLQTTDYSYFQGMDGDIKDATGATRTASLTSSDGNTTVTDSLWWAGDTFETITYNGLGGPVVSDTVTVPWASDPTETGTGVSEKVGTSGSTFTYTPTARHTGTAKTLTYEPLSTGGLRTTETQNTFDSYGRVTAAEDDGDTSTSADDRCTRTSYNDNTTAWLLDLPSEVNSYAGDCASLPADPASATISDVRTYYDGATSLTTPPVRGDATKAEQATSYTGTTPTWTTQTTASFDALGRALTSSDALGRTTTTSYTPSAPAAGATVSGDIGPATATATTDPMGFTTTDTINPAWGSTTTEIDVNNHVTTTAYDALGRVTGVWNPDRPQASNPVPSIGYAYTVTAGAPLAVATTTLTPTGGTQTSYQLYDGLGRPRQTQNPAESATYNATPGSGGSSVTETNYNFAGQATMNYGPYWINAAPSAALYVPTAYGTVPSATGTEYDGAGRTTATVTYTYGTEQWRTNTAYPGVDRTDVIPPAGGTPTTTFTDARGNKTALLQWHGASIGDVNDPTQYDKTSYTYDPTGPMATMTNPGGEQWSWSYDVSGNVTTAVDPDTGTTRSSYDADNELQSTTDANGTTLWYSYDADGRKTAVNQDSATGPLLDMWQYDQLPGAKGLLDSSTSYAGPAPAAPYTETVTGYDADGRPTGTSTTLPAGALYSGSPAYTYTTSATYNPDGSLATETEPAAGGVPAETLRYTYTSLGRLYSLLGAKQYLTGTGYDPATGLIVGQQRDNGINSLNDAYTYTPGTMRLSEDQVTTSAKSNNLVADLHYSYDNAGLITSVSNTPSGQLADTQCYQYDYAQRLTQAWTPSDSNCSNAPSSSNLGGPAPYWQSYTYTANGDRASTTDHATYAGGTDTADLYSYPSAGSAQPNTLTDLASYTAPAGSNTWSLSGVYDFSYNADGQTTNSIGYPITWTPQGQLATITNPAGQTQDRIYDANGNLIIQTDPVNGTTAYLGDTELHVPAGSATITGQRIYTANGNAVAVRHGASTLAWLDTDPHGTADITESFTTAAVTTRYYDPFGAPRGTQPAWPEDRGFLNAPTDTFSNLTTLGAREYAPTLGRFMSADPLLDTSDPQSFTGYAYADNNPVDEADPSGAMRVEISGGLCGDNDLCGANPVILGSTFCDRFPEAPACGGNGSDPYTRAHAHDRSPITGTYTTPSPKPEHHHGCGGFFGCIGHAFSSGFHSVTHMASVALHGIAKGVEWLGKEAYKHSNTLATAFAICAAIPGADLACGGPALVFAGISTYKDGRRCFGSGGAADCEQMVADLLFVGAGKLLDRGAAAGVTSPFETSPQSWRIAGVLTFGGISLGVDRFMHWN